VIDIFTHIPRMPEVTPDDRAAMRDPYSGPRCQRCNRRPTDANPIGFTLRRDARGFDSNPRAGIDAICASCRERYRG
jgi:hypothetical protein